MGRRIVIYLTGLATTALGIALIILSFVGAGPWDAVATGLANHLGLTIGTWSIISQIAFTLITWLLEKTRFRIESMIPIAIRSFFLDIWIYVVLANVDFSFSWVFQWSAFTMGLILAGVGMGIYMEARFPKTPIDGLMVALSQKWNWSLNKSRMSIEITGVILGFLLSGPVGFGTIVTALFLGRIIQFSNAKVKKLLSTQTDTVEIQA
ncbi:YczE/YyaS/YitT family protein [Niallia sp. Krafla_26]|uniref:YczE/YyaS/YitT family protein n=1 Tax=Niallia sp. Krafla_26 TaxID=3064703 RepID=UPI003D164D09